MVCARWAKAINAGLPHAYFDLISCEDILLFWFSIINIPFLSSIYLLTEYESEGRSTVRRTMGVIL